MLHQRARVLQHPLAPQDPPGTARHVICLYTYLIDTYRLFCPSVPCNKRFAERLSLLRAVVLVYVIKYRKQFYFIYQ